jgi:hypothetical protein
MRALKNFGALSSCTILAFFIAARSDSPAQTHQDKYTLKVPGGLAFSEFRGYESRQLISISHGGPVMAATLGNPVMIKAYMDGIPGNSKPVPAAVAPDTNTPLFR